MEHHCLQCPRTCGADRANGKLGYCGVPWSFLVARAALHQWEEPSISGNSGSGTIFFSGCNLHCVFCQNREISHGALGKEVSPWRLAELMLRLRDEGAHNINLVTPTPYAYQLVRVLEQVKPALGIPIIYNCGGYESTEGLRRLDGLVDVYLPDIKYHSSELSARYSGAADYSTVSRQALREMLRQVGAPQFDCNGLIRRGTIVRHLVLPGARADSIDLLCSLAGEFGSHAFYFSLMSQYTPQFADTCPYKELHRRVTSFEYDTVLAKARELGFEGYFQSRESAVPDFTPSFSESIKLL